MKTLLLALSFLTLFAQGAPAPWVYGPDNKSLNLQKGVALPQSTTPGSPVSGRNYLYFKSDDNLYIKNHSGAETQVTGGSGGGGTAPTFSKATATGTGTGGFGSSTTGYLFTVTSANATLGAIYTNNSLTYTVTATIASGTQLFTTQASAPLSSGTLTKASGTGDATISFSLAEPLATYTVPTSPSTPKALKLKGVGGGGGGSGSGPGSIGSNGGTTTFGSLFLILNGGIGATYSVTPSPGAAATYFIGTLSGATIFGQGWLGGMGNSPPYAAAPGIYPPGGAGAGTPFGPGGPVALNAAGKAPSPNTGAGGGGGGQDGTPPSGAGGFGGNAGANLEVMITGTLPATFQYSIGPGGAGGATSGGSPGGAAAAGIWLVEEDY